MAYYTILIVLFQYLRKKYIAFRLYSESEGLYLIHYEFIPYSPAYT